MVSVPYVVATGNISKALDGIKNAASPPKITQDFVKTVLKIPGGSGDAMTTFLKRLGFANSDGSVTEIYTEFRNPTQSPFAMARAIKLAFKDLYQHNEFCHLLNDEELKGLIVEVTGNAPDSRTVSASVSTFKNLKTYANFDNPIVSKHTDELDGDSRKFEDRSDALREVNIPQAPLGLNLGYTINLNLPATSDIKVFDAIFKSLKQNLLSTDD
jgi:hypothetical protein